MKELAAIRPGPVPVGGREVRRGLLQLCYRSVIQDIGTYVGSLPNRFQGRLRPGLDLDKEVT